MDTIITSILSSTVLIAILAYIVKNWFLERLKTSLQKEYGRYLSELQWEEQTKLQASKVAEYMSFARLLSENSPPEDYIKANQLSWELAMWLPEEIYKELTLALSNPNTNINELSTVITVRKLLLKDKAGELNQDQIMHHAPGIGKKS